MGAGGVFLRFGSFGLRILQFLCAAIIVGIFSYFLAVLADNNVSIAARWKAVEGISGAAVLYTICGFLLTLCLGGVAFFGFLAVVLDILFIGGFIAIAWFTRSGANSCSGFVNTPLGSGNPDQGSIGYGVNNSTISPKLHLACRLNTVVFAVSIISCFLFALSAIWQIMMVRHHKKEKKYGPGPSNGYTSGSGRRPFWKRNKRGMRTKDAEAATAVRTSHETGTTLGGNNYAGAEPKYGEPGYGQTGYAQPGYGHTGHTQTGYNTRTNAGHF